MLNFESGQNAKKKFLLTAKDMNVPERRSAPAPQCVTVNKNCTSGFCGKISIEVCRTVCSMQGGE